MTHDGPGPEQSQPAEQAEPMEQAEPVEQDQQTEQAEQDQQDQPAPGLAKQVPAKPGPRPGSAPTPKIMAPKPKPKPGSPASPGDGATGAAAAPGRSEPAVPSPRTAPVATPPVHDTPLSEAVHWGRADDDGNVFVRVDGVEHGVGQYPGVSRDEALAYFVRKYDDVAGQVTLLEQRVAAQAPSTDMRKTVEHLAELVTERAMVGDVAGLKSRVDALTGDIAGLERNEKARHDEAKSAELQRREAIVAEAEQIAAQDPATVQWKHSSTRMNELFDAWKTAQKTGIRIGRGAEDALWKRFRSARTVFDRHRRAFFSQLDSDNAEAKAAKEKLIARAEEMSTSTEWGATSGEYRRLMDEWKATKRASRKDDDALWARFRAAQDTFFNARNAANEAIDEQYAANLTVKEELLAEAKALLPIKDVSAAKKSLQSIRQRWDDAGKVPRSAMDRMESGIRAVEDAVREADDEHWRRSDPRTKARTNDALGQLEQAIADLQADLDSARKNGNEKKIRQAEQALAARQQWFEQISKSARDLH